MCRGGSAAPSFRDPFAFINGREALHAHIEEVLAMSPPGGRLVRSRPVEPCHGHVRFSCGRKDPTARLCDRHQFRDLACDGRLSRVVGFRDKTS
ncbi:MAG: hypothetical protein ABR610_05370 [Thermoanaerobaculia bacterium]